MSFITAEQAAELQGSVVRIATLVEMRFKTTPMYLWNGAGTQTIAGVDWQGVGALGSIDGLKQIRNGESAKFTLKLSGVDAEVVRIAKDESDEVQGRSAYIWGQLFAATGHQWTTVGPKIPLAIGTMQRIVLARSEGNDGMRRVASIECENPFAARSRPPSRRYTDADHQALHPGDPFCQWVAGQNDLIVTWPDF